MDDDILPHLRSRLCTRISQDSGRRTETYLSILTAPVLNSMSNSDVDNGGGAEPNVVRVGKFRPSQRSVLRLTVLIGFQKGIFFTVQWDPRLWGKGVHCQEYGPEFPLKNTLNLLYLLVYCGNYYITVRLLPICWRPVHSVGFFTSNFDCTHAQKASCFPANISKF